MGASRSHRKPASIELEEQRRDYANWWAGKLNAQDKAMKRAGQLWRMLTALAQEYPAVADNRAEFAHPRAEATEARSEGEANASNRKVESFGRAKFTASVDPVRRDQSESISGSAASNEKIFNSDSRLDSEKETTSDAALESEGIQMGPGDKPQGQQTEAPSAMRHGGRRTDRDQGIQPREESSHFDPRQASAPTVARKDREVLERRKEEQQKRFSRATTPGQTRDAWERREFSEVSTVFARAEADAQSESVANVGAAVVGALTQNTQIVVSTLNSLLEALQKQNTSIAGIQADITKITGGNRGTLRTQ